MKLRDGADNRALYDEDRIDFFFSALQELRTKLSVIEAEHPFLHNDFSSVCDDAISRLNTAESSQENISAYHREEQKAVTLLDAMEPRGYPANDIAIEPMLTHPRINPVVSAIDRAGGYLVFCLDKMGDGIIIAFESLLKLGNGRNGKEDIKSDPHAWGIHK